MSQPKGEGTTIKYSGGVTNASGERGNFVNKPNTVARYQKFFQVSEQNFNSGEALLRFCLLVYGRHVFSWYGIVFWTDPHRK